MTRKLSVLFIVTAIFCMEVHAEILPATDFSVSDPAPGTPGGGMDLFEMEGSGIGGQGPGPSAGSAPGADEQIENDRAEANRRLNALLESIRSYAKKRHSLSEERDRAGAAELKNALKSIEDFLKQKKLAGFSEIDAKYREAFLLNDQFNLSETLQDIWDLKKEIEAFNRLRSGYSFAQEDESVKRFEDAMKKIEKFAKDVCNRYDAEEGVASEMRRARELLHGYVSPAKADTLSALREIDRRILEFNRIKHTYTESQRNASKAAFENAIREKEDFAKSRRFNGDTDFKDLLKLVKEHLNDDRTPMTSDMDALNAMYGRMPKPLSVGDINMMRNEIGNFQSKYGSALKQDANRNVNNQFHSLCDKVRQAMVERLGIERSYRQIKNAITDYERNRQSRSADACRAALNEIQVMIDNFKAVFKNTSTENFISWFTGDWINGDDYTAYRSDINLIENKLKEYRKELETGKPSGPALQNIPTAAELDRELEAVKRTLERAVDRISQGKNSEAEAQAKDAVSKLFHFKNSHMKKIEADYRQMTQNLMQIPVLERDPYFYGKLKVKYDDYQRMADKVTALIAGEVVMLEAIRNDMTLYERNVRWKQNINARHSALDGIKRLIQAFKDAYNKSWDKDLGLVTKLNFSKLKDVYDKYKDEINQINSKIDAFWDETHAGGMTPLEAFNLLKREFMNYETLIRNKKSKQEMLTAIESLDAFTENYKKNYKNILKLPEYSQTLRELDRMEKMIEDYRNEARSMSDQPVLQNYTPQQQVMRNKMISDINSTYTDISRYKDNKGSMSDPDKKLYKDAMDKKFSDLEDSLKKSPFKDDKELKDALRAARDYWNKIK